MIQIQSNFECAGGAALDINLTIVYKIFAIAAESGNSCWADKGGSAPKKISELLRWSIEDDLYEICAIIEYVSSGRLHLVQYGSYPTLAVRVYYADYRQRANYSSIIDNLEQESIFINIRENFLLKYPIESDGLLSPYSMTLRDLIKPYATK